jgi:hypothetical protein
MRWKAAHDDPDAGGDADLGCLRGHRYEEGQEVLKKSPHSGHMFVFRGKRADRIKILWWDGTGLCLYTAICLAADVRRSRDPDTGAMRPIARNDEYKNPRGQKIPSRKNGRVASPAPRASDEAAVLASAHAVSSTQVKTSAFPSAKRITKIALS